MKYKKTTLFFIIINTFLFAECLYSQNDLSYKTLNNNIQELMYSNPEQAGNICKMLLDNNSIKPSELIKINLISAKIYKAKGDYSTSLKFLFDKKNMVMCYQTKIK